MRLLDSNIIIYATDPENEWLRIWLEAEPFAISQISQIEVHEGAQLVGEPLSAKPATRPRASAATCAGSSNLMHASLTDSVAGWKRLPSVRASSSYVRYRSVAMTCAIADSSAAS